MEGEREGERMNSWEERKTERENKCRSSAISSQGSSQRQSGIGLLGHNSMKYVGGELDLPKGLRGTSAKRDKNNTHLSNKHHHKHNIFTTRPATAMGVRVHPNIKSAKGTSTKLLRQTSTFSLKGLSNPETDLLLRGNLTYREDSTNKSNTNNRSAHDPPNKEKLNLNSQAVQILLGIYIIYLL